MKRRTVRIHIPSNMTCNDIPMRRRIVGIYHLDISGDADGANVYASQAWYQCYMLDNSLIQIESDKIYLHYL